MLIEDIYEYTGLGAGIENPQVSNTQLQQIAHGLIEETYTFKIKTNKISTLHLIILTGTNVKGLYINCTNTELGMTLLWGGQEKFNRGFIIEEEL